MDRRQFTWGAVTAATASAFAHPAFAQLATPPAAAQAAGTPVVASVPRLDGKHLRPGQFEWAPDISPAGPLVFIVSLPEQRVHIYRNGVRIGVSTCSTGKPGHLTPTGVFVILQKDKDHKSSIYDSAPMPNMQRLTWSGIALHAGNLPGYPASHGCVRLPKQFSKIIFDETHLGIPVIICDNKSQPNVVVHPGFILPAEAEAVATGAMSEAARKLDRKDIMSAVVSGHDRKAIVLIDGKVIWESELDLVDPLKPLGETSFTLLGPAPEGGTYRWMAHDLHRSHLTIGKHDAILSRIKVKKIEDQKRMLAAAKGNPTLVVTDGPAAMTTHTRSDFVIADALTS